MSDDPYDLERFVEAQEPVIGRVRAELEAGRKTSHWMWFVFPQIEGLGFSPMAVRYAISGPDEARAYLAHPVLGPRLVELTRTVCRHAGKTALEILGAPDDMKFRSCLTLFAAVADDPAPFREALRLFYDGEDDPHTLARLG
ncbi:MAG TPA: DUF1810 domain-containing protein [Caulobacteraceae bacterium]|nr:DUF1810 domain-containing protein [Caulobacteraceae bacterium]